MEKEEYEVEVTVHRQSNRAFTTKLKVMAYTPGAAQAVAEGQAIDTAGDVDFNQFSEESVHYEAEASTVTKL